MPPELTPENAAIAILVAHLTGQQQADTETMGRALAAISVSRDFATLGHVVYRALLAHNLARLRARRAEAVDELAELGAVPREAPPHLH